MHILGDIGQFANNVYEIKAKKELMIYYHKYCFIPVLSTWIHAIENDNCCTWPGLPATAVRKYLPKSMVTAKGHM